MRSYFMMLLAFLLVETASSQPVSVKKAIEYQPDVRDNDTVLDISERDQIRFDSLIVTNLQLDSIITGFTGFYRRINSTEKLKVSSFLIIFSEQDKTLYMEVTEGIGSDVFFDGIYGNLQGYKFIPYGYFNYNGCSFYVATYQPSEEPDESYLKLFFDRVPEKITIEKSKRKEDVHTILYENPVWLYSYVEGKFRLESSCNTKHLVQLHN